MFKYSGAALSPAVSASMICLNDAIEVSLISVSLNTFLKAIRSLLPERQLGFCEIVSTL